MTIPTKPGRRIRLLVAAVALAVGGLVAAYFVVSSPPTREAPAPTVVATPASAPTTTTSSGSVAAGPATSATTTTTVPTTTTVAVVQLTTTTTQAPTTTTQVPRTTTAAATSTTTAAPVEASEHEYHDEAVQTGEVCHNHGDAVSEHCHTYEYPTTTAPDPEATGDCPGNYHQWFKVRDECVLDEVQKEFLAWRAGTHEQRMASIRDGHLLAQVFADSHASAEQYFGEEAANDLSTWTSVYADADNRGTRRVEIYGAQWTDPDRIDVRIRAVMKDGSFAWAWNVVPFTYVDSQWKISYQGFCRFIDASTGFVEDHGGTLRPCPPDPRPGVVTNENVYSAYDPTDDPTRTEVNRTPGW